MTQESFRAGGLYPDIRSEEYLFDRVTGERLSIADLVENSPEEIMEFEWRYYLFDCVYSESLDEERGWQDDGYWKPEALEAELAKQWEAGTLLEYLEKHDASDRRELSQEEILSYIRGDYSDVYCQVREACEGSEIWFVVVEECSNLEVIIVTEDGYNLVFDGGGKGFVYREEEADCYFLSFEGDGYLVYPHLGENGEVTELHTYGMNIDPYADWRLWQQMEVDGNIAKSWAAYIVYF